MKYPKNYVVYDFEATGINPHAVEAVEIAAVRVENNKVVSRFEKLMKTENAVLEAGAIAVHGITEEMLEAEGVTQKEGYKEFWEWLGRDISKVPLVGHNIMRYDNIILLRGLTAAGCLEKDELKLDSLKRCIDTAAIFKAKKMDEEQQWYEGHAEFAVRILETRVFGLKYNLSAACEELNIDCKDLVAHRAAADVEMTRRIYEKLTQPTTGQTALPL